MAAVVEQDGKQLVESFKFSKLRTASPSLSAGVLVGRGQREEFVLAAQPGGNFSALCREFGISRKTGYK